MARRGSGSVSSGWALAAGRLEDFPRCADFPPLRAGVRLEELPRAAGEVRVAIGATLPDSGDKSPNIRAKRALFLPRTGTHPGKESAGSLGFEDHRNDHRAAAEPAVDPGTHHAADNLLPDLVILEFAVNDEGDETEGVFYESLVKHILDKPNHPAVILLFAVFSDDWNLKKRLAPIGLRYELPMVDVLEAVAPQFEAGSACVIRKRQYFYDVYHPSNMGHRIMADCLLYMLSRLPPQFVGQGIL